MNDRKLATVQRISSLEPINGADNIELAKIKGWEVVVKKGEFKVGQQCVYCEIDSILPDRPEFEFLKPRGMRIRTVRLKGQISQGVCFPMKILLKKDREEESYVISSLDRIMERLDNLPDFKNAIIEVKELYIEEINNSALLEVYSDGQDVTSELGIKKYEPPPIPAILNGIAKGSFPSFIPKTDEERVQNLEEYLDKYSDKYFSVTEKLDGTSATYYLKDGKFGVCSRNLELEDGDNIYWNIFRNQKIDALLLDMSDFYKCNVAVQGEIIGEGIQSNKYCIKGNKLYLFNIYNIDKSKYLDPDIFSTRGPSRLMDPMRNWLRNEWVPFVVFNDSLNTNVHYLVSRSKIKSAINPDIWAEGIVFRSKRNDLDTRSGKFSFKVINPEFLLHYGE